MGTQQQLVEEQEDILFLADVLDEIIVLEDVTRIDKLRDEAMSSYTMDSDEVDKIIEELQYFGYMDKEYEVTIEGRQYLKQHSQKENKESTIVNQTFIEKQEIHQKNTPLSNVKLSVENKISAVSVENSVEKNVTPALKIGKIVGFLRK